MAIGGVGANYGTNFPSSNNTEHVSRRGRFFGQLSDTAASDPAKAKQMASDMAATMRSRASSATGNRAAAWSRQADILDNAAKSGDFSQLEPAGHRNWDAASHSSR